MSIGIKCFSGLNTQIRMDEFESDLAFFVVGNLVSFTIDLFEAFSFPSSLTQ